jgi:phosphoribosylformylglycinamidine synthase
MSLSVLDLAGTAVRSGLEHMGYTNVDRVRIGKYMKLSLTTAAEADARQQLDRMCDPVMENCRFDLTAVAASPA